MVLALPEAVVEATEDGTVTTGGTDTVSELAEVTRVETVPYDAKDGVVVVKTTDGVVVVKTTDGAVSVVLHEVMVSAVAVVVTTTDGVVSVVPYDGTGTLTEDTVGMIGTETEYVPTEGTATVVEEGTTTTRELDLETSGVVTTDGTERTTEV